MLINAKEMTLKIYIYDDHGCFYVAEHSHAYFYF